MANRSGRTPWEEFWKQTVDQPLHAVWGLTTGYCPHFTERLGAYAAEFFGDFDPWEMFLPGLLLGGVLSLGSVVGWMVREFLQLRDGSHVWWDPWLDSLVFLLALVIGFTYPFWC